MQAGDALYSFADGAAVSLPLPPASMEDSVDGSSVDSYWTDIVASNDDGERRDDVDRVEVTLPAVSGQQKRRSEENDGADDADDDTISLLYESIPVCCVSDANGGLAFNQLALQRYLLHCAQATDGGMRGLIHERIFLVSIH